MGNILFPGNCLSVFPEIVFVFANLFPPVFQLFSILIKIEMSVFIMDKSLQYRFGIFRGRNHRCFRWNFGRNFCGVICGQFCIQICRMDSNPA